MLKKRNITTTSEWAKHLRKTLKRQFWKGEKGASKKILRNTTIEFKK